MNKRFYDIQSDRNADIDEDSSLTKKKMKFKSIHTVSDMLGNRDKKIFRKTNWNGMENMQRE